MGAFPGSTPPVSIPLTIVHPDGEVSSTKSRKLVERLLDGGHAVRVAPHRIAMLGAGLYELRVAQSGHGGPTVVQRRLASDRRKAG